MGLFKKKESSNQENNITATKENIFKKLSRAIAGKSKVDDEVLDKLEEVLVTSDVGVETTLKIINRIEEKVQKEKFLGIEELNVILKNVIALLLEENKNNISTDFFKSDLPKPYVILVVGVNGVGKTTTIGKLAYQFKLAGKSVILGAADTFRAAAVDQLTIWSQRVGVEIVKQQMGADPASYSL